MYVCGVCEYMHLYMNKYVGVSAFMSDCLSYFVNVMYLCIPFEDEEDLERPLELTSMARKDTAAAPPRLSRLAGSAKGRRGFPCRRWM